MTSIVSTPGLPARVRAAWRAFRLTLAALVTRSDPKPSGTGTGGAVG